MPPCPFSCLFLKLFHGFERGFSLCFTARIWVRAGTIFFKKDVSYLQNASQWMFHFSSKPFKANPSHAGMDMFSEEFEEIDVAFQSPSEKSCDALIA